GPVRAELDVGLGDAVGDERVPAVLPARDARRGDPVADLPLPLGHELTHAPRRDHVLVDPLARARDRDARAAALVAGGGLSVHDLARAAGPAAELLRARPSDRAPPAIVTALRGAVGVRRAELIGGAARGVRGRAASAVDVGLRAVLDAVVRAR